MENKKNSNGFSFSSDQLSRDELHLTWGQRLVLAPVSFIFLIGLGVFIAIAGALIGIFCLVGAVVSLFRIIVLGKAVIVKSDGKVKVKL